MDLSCFPTERKPLGFLETIWELRNSPGWKRYDDRVHIHFDRKQAVVMVAEVSETFRINAHFNWKLIHEVNSRTR